MVGVFVGLCNRLGSNGVDGLDCGTVGCGVCGAIWIRRICLRHRGVADNVLHVDGYRDTRECDSIGDLGVGADPTHRYFDGCTGVVCLQQQQITHAYPCP